MQNLTPLQTWAYLQQHPDALFVDVRMVVEYLYVGHPPGVVHIAWYEYPDLLADSDRFVGQLRREAGRDDLPPVLICRSGKRTVEARIALEAVGFTTVVNVLHGFEGELDAHFQRGRLSDWRFDGRRCRQAVERNLGPAGGPASRSHRPPRPAPPSVPAAAPSW